jgi:hypothetical protein
MSIKLVGNVVGERLQGIRVPVGENRLSGATRSASQRREPAAARWRFIDIIFVRSRRRPPPVQDPVQEN